VSVSEYSLVYGGLGDQKLKESSCVFVVALRGGDREERKQCNTVLYSRKRPKRAVLVEDINLLQ